MSKKKTVEEVTVKPVTVGASEFEAALKSEVKSPEPAKAPQVVEEEILDGVAITILKTTINEYVIVKIPVDTKNLKAGKVEVIDTAFGKMEAVEKFKIACFKHNII